MSREFTLKSEEACLTGAAGGEDAEESLEGEAIEAVVILSDAGDGGGDAAAVTSVVVIVLPVVSLTASRSSFDSLFSSGASFIARTLNPLKRDGQRSLRPIVTSPGTRRPSHTLFVRPRSRSATK